jgi:LAO/AO transport system kinase
VYIGKSTFIECLGQHLIQEGHKVAVLAVDPSSTRTGGSILGDKTRMNVLSRDPNAFVRPSPSQGFLGGVTANMYEIITLCESAGYDRILVETVGVGQSETQVADLTDMVCLLVPPSGGDELQGIKRGIVEVADMIIVNKADGKLVSVAKRSAREYQNALHLLSPKSLADSVLADNVNPEELQIWYPPVLCCTSLSHVNFDNAVNEKDIEAKVYAVRNALDKMNEYQVIQHKNGQWAARRRNQRKSWMWKQVSEDLITRLFHHSDTLKRLVKDLQAKVTEGQLSPRIASELVLKEFVAEYSNTTSKQ